MTERNTKAQIIKNTRYKIIRRREMKREVESFRKLVLRLIITKQERKKFVLLCVFFLICRKLNDNKKHYDN